MRHYRNNKLRIEIGVWLNCKHCAGNVIPLYGKNLRFSLGCYSFYFTYNF